MMNQRNLLFYLLGVLSGTALVLFLKSKKGKKMMKNVSNNWDKLKENYNETETRVKHNNQQYD
jgi:hypothetical protein